VPPRHYTSYLRQDHWLGLLPAKWGRIAARFLHNLRQDYLGLIAAGVAFYFLLAAFPALAALISIYGLFADPATVARQLNLLAGFLPPEALKILSEQATKLADASIGALNLSLIGGIVLTIYSATKGVGALIKGLNIAYNLPEKRNMATRLLIAYALTFVLMVYLLFSLTAIAGLPAVLQFIHLPANVADIILMARWPILFTMALVGLQILYNFGPSHDPHRGWRWASAGATVATILWIILSSLFSLFVSNLGKYNETYGSLGAVIVLLLWFWLSALMILLGAEVNASLQDDSETELPDT